MILASSCLAGNRCRYNGKDSLCPKILVLVKSGKAIPFCPELAGGLLTPRSPAEIRKEKVVTKEGKDVTKEFEKGAQEGLKLALILKCKEAILKARSPSCGRGSIYDGSFSNHLIKGNGVFAALLIKNGITVKTEEEI